MMRLVVRSLLLVLAALLVVALGARFVRPTPDLVAVTVGVLALRSGWRTGAAAGLAGGWVLDLLPPGADVIGLSAVTYAAAGAVTGRMRRPGPMSWLLVASACALTALTVRALDVLRALLRSGPVDWGGGTGQLLATATVGLLIGPALMWLDARLGPDRE